MATGVETREAVKSAVIEAASRTAASRPSTAAAAAATDASESASPPPPAPTPALGVGPKLASPIPAMLPARLHGLWLRRGDAWVEDGREALVAKAAPSVEKSTAAVASAGP